MRSFRSVFMSENRMVLFINRIVKVSDIFYSGSWLRVVEFYSFI